MCIWLVWAWSCFVFGCYPDSSCIRLGLVYEILIIPDWFLVDNFALAISKIDENRLWMAYYFDKYHLALAVWALVTPCSTPPTFHGCPLISQHSVYNALILFLIYQMITNMTFKLGHDHLTVNKISIPVHCRILRIFTNIFAYFENCIFPSSVKSKKGNKVPIE